MRSQSKILDGTVSTDRPIRFLYKQNKNHRFYKSYETCNLGGSNTKQSISTLSSFSTNWRQIEKQYKSHTKRFSESVRFLYGMTGILALLHPRSWDSSLDSFQPPIQACRSWNTHSPWQQGWHESTLQIKSSLLSSEEDRMSEGHNCITAN